MDTAESGNFKPQVRLCVITKEHPDQEYGFDLNGGGRHNEHFIGLVVKDSPAEHAELRAGDRILAVNGEPVEGIAHRDVVSFIKQNPMKTELLVIDLDGAKWYLDRGLKLPSSLLQNGVCNGNLLHHDDDDVSQSVSSSSNSAPKPKSSSISSDVHDQNCQAKDQDFDESNAQVADFSLQKPLPFLCILERSSAQEQYGFTLHAEKGKPHYIGPVDSGSLAEIAGAKTGLRVVGVNGTLVYMSSSYTEVIELIKKHPLRAELLLATPETEQFYRTHGLEFSFTEAVSSPAKSQPGVLRNGSLNNYDKVEINNSYQPHIDKTQEVASVNACDEIKKCETVVTNEQVNEGKIFEEGNVIIDELNTYLDKTEPEETVYSANVEDVPACRRTSEEKINDNDHHTSTPNTANAQSAEVVTHSGPIQQPIADQVIAVDDTVSSGQLQDANCAITPVLLHYERGAAVYEFDGDTLSPPLIVSSSPAPSADSGVANGGTRSGTGSPTDDVSSSPMPTDAGALCSPMLSTSSQSDDSSVDALGAKYQLHSSGLEKNGHQTPPASPIDPPTLPPPQIKAVSPINQTTDLNEVFSLSAAEVKLRLQARKKVDPRKSQTQMSSKEKYQFIQNL